MIAASCNLEDFFELQVTDRNIGRRRVIGGESRIPASLNVRSGEIRNQVVIDNVSGSLGISRQVPNDCVSSRRSRAARFAFTERTAIVDLPATDWRSASVLAFNCTAPDSPGCRF